jgi:DNA invertase Pin-like site-specific DNA recombinase
MLDPEVDTTSPSGKAMVGIMAVVAELERELIRERTTAALRAKGERKGRRPNSTRPCADGLSARSRPAAPRSPSPGS